MELGVGCSGCELRRLRHISRRHEAKTLARCWGGPGQETLGDRDIRDGDGGLSSADCYGQSELDDAMDAPRRVPAQAIQDFICLGSRR